LLGPGKETKVVWFENYSSRKYIPLNYVDICILFYFIFILRTKSFFSDIIFDFLGQKWSQNFLELFFNVGHFLGPSCWNLTTLG
jgi:hypothetical protein